MGQGNVCVTGSCEGLYYIDNDHFHIYRRDVPGKSEECESKMLGELHAPELARLDHNRQSILESSLFHIAIEDNEWSLAIELVQKEGLYGDNLYGLQARHYQKYLEGMKRCLLEHLPSIGIRTGAWTSDVIKREECFA